MLCIMYLLLRFPYFQIVKLCSLTNVQVKGTNLLFLMLRNPWQDEHNSCPICRHELRTDDHAYESWKELEKEAEEERKGAANAVRGGEYLYI